MSEQYIDSIMHGATMKGNLVFFYMKFESNVLQILLLYVQNNLNYFWKFQQCNKF